MKRTAHFFACCAVGATALGTGSRVQADILDDILSLTTAARDRATQARDRAVEARDRATEARNSANELRDNARLGLEALTGQIRDLIDEAVEDMQRLVESELEGRDAFVADGGCSLAVCEPFRESLVTLLQDIETLANTLLTIAELDGAHLDLQRERDIVNLLPGRALYPLYRVLGGDGNLMGNVAGGSGLLQRMSEMVDQLLVLKSALEEQYCGSEPAVDDTLLGSEVKKCACVQANANAVENAAKGIKYTGMGIKLIGKRLKAKGETTASGANPGIHGYIQVTIKDNKRKEWGETLEGLGDALSKVAESADDKLRDCLVFSTQAEILQGLSDVKGQRRGDFNDDGVIDLADYSQFQLVFGGK